MQWILQQDATFVHVSYNFHEFIFSLQFQASTKIASD
jgi:hypothetical protein